MFQNSFFKSINREAVIPIFEMEDIIIHVNRLEEVEHASGQHWAKKYKLIKEALGLMDIDKLGQNMAPYYDTCLTDKPDKW